MSSLRPEGLAVKGLARFLFEAGMLKKMRRTGYHFLGSGGESVADHCFRASLLGYHLALLDPALDAPRVALMLMHHDLAESRTNDLNYVHKRYAKADEKRPPGSAGRAAARWRADAGAGRRIRGWVKPRGPSFDADQLDLLVELKEQKDMGNPYATHWIHYALKRLDTPAGQELAPAILDTGWTDWWFEKRDDWWAPPKN
ncbi:HD domain-containing protein [Desulfarculales bacterium]